MSLEVLYAPIVSVIAKKEIEEGENVWIKCNVSSNPRPASIEWIKMDDPNFRQTGDILRYGLIFKKLRVTVVRHCIISCIIIGLNVCLLQMWEPTLAKLSI